MLRGTPLFLALAFATLASSEASLSLVWLVAAMAALWLTWFSSSRDGSATKLSWIGVSVGGLAAWIVLDGLVLQRSYDPYALYQAGFLVLGFLVGRGAGASRLASTFRVFLAYALLLAVWALWQLIAQGGQRPSAAFDTPATMSTVLNLVLVPALVIFALRGGTRWLIAALVVLAAGLFAANSRGGWLAGAAAALVGFLVSRRAGDDIVPRRRQWILAATIASGWLLARIAALVGGLLGVEVFTLPVADAGLSLIARLGMYRLALQSLSFATLPDGIGFSGFFYLMRTHPDAVAGYENGITSFVHDDYLQALLERGLPGLAGLLAIVLLPNLAAWLAVRRAEAPEQRALIAGLCAGLASMSIHALADFPFYIPASLAMYGIGLGMLEVQAKALPLRLPGAELLLRLEGMSGRIGHIAFGALVSWLLFASAGAEVASRIGMRQWQAGENESAAYWLRVAERLQPRDWRYHWRAAEFWFGQAAASDKPAAARLAERAYAEAYDANPREAYILVRRIALHRSLARLFDSPADPRQLVAWADEAVRLAPNNVAARRERDLVLRQFAQPRRDGQNGELMKEGRRHGAS